MAAKKKSKKKSKKSKSNGDSYEFKAPGDAKIEVIKVIDFTEHGENHTTATVLQLAKWNDGDEQYEKRQLYRKQSMIEEFEVEDITEVPWHVGKLKGITPEEMGKMLSVRAEM